MALSAASRGVVDTPVPQPCTPNSTAGQPWLRLDMRGTGSPRTAPGRGTGAAGSHSLGTSLISMYIQPGPPNKMDSVRILHLALDLSDRSKWERSSQPHFNGVADCSVVVLGMAMVMAHGASVAPPPPPPWLSQVGGAKLHGLLPLED
ncbi:hypothetical protein CPLU01_15091 [Colletotrichum plurivorum]|uniref:Uncharacterized protein n=1 Tax=Colletotrichum plurivorum TaxID=2175906 RepID=A0A8H6JEQ3_9PEZI|nr:hypothetical protein CPLU01_15091 [Colletotrichum plurivorum]